MARSILSTLANIGEFIGGIAVLVTIVYFAIQLRASLNANKAQALASWTSAAQAETEIIYGDSEVDAIYRNVVFESEKPEGDSAIRFYAYCIQLMNSWQLAFVQCELGVTKQEFLDRISSGYADFLSNKHVRAWWDGQGYRLYDVAFVVYVNDRSNVAT